MVRKTRKRTGRWQPCWVPRWQASSISLRLRLSPDVPSFRYGLFRRAVRHQYLHDSGISCAVGFRLTAACLTSWAPRMMLVGRAGVRAANDGNFRKFTVKWIKRYSEKGLLLAAVKMTALMILTIMNLQRR